MLDHLALKSPNDPLAAIETKAAACDTTTTSVVEDKWKYKKAECTTLGSYI